MRAKNARNHNQIRNSHSLSLSLRFVFFVCEGYILFPSSFLRYSSLRLSLSHSLFSYLYILIVFIFFISINIYATVQRVYKLASHTLYWIPWTTTLYRNQIRKHSRAPKTTLLINKKLIFFLHFRKKKKRNKSFLFFSSRFITNFLRREKQRKPLEPHLEKITKYRILTPKNDSEITDNYGNVCINNYECPFYYFSQNSTVQESPSEVKRKQKSRKNKWSTGLMSKPSEGRWQHTKKRTFRRRLKQKKKSPRDCGRNLMFLPPHPAPFSSSSALQLRPSCSSSLLSSSLFFHLSFCSSRAIASSIINATSAIFSDVNPQSIISPLPSTSPPPPPSPQRYPRSFRLSCDRHRSESTSLRSFPLLVDAKLLLCSQFSPDCGPWLQVPFGNWTWTPL